MSKTSSKVITSAALLLAFGLMAGCATSQKTSVIEEVQTTANDAAAAAKAAQETADNAMNAAQGSRESVDAARRAADDATATANRALEMSERNSAAIKELNEKIDRMFKKAMHK